MSPIEISFLAEYLGKASVVVGLGFVTCFLIRRQLPSLKHQIWIGLFAVCLIIPLILLLPGWRVIPKIGTENSSGVSFEPPAQHVTSDYREGLSVATIAKDEPEISWQTLVVLGWGFGALVIFGRSLIARLLLSRVDAASKSAPEQIAKVTSRVSSDFGLCRDVEVSISGQVASPFVWGIRRPKILLPSDSVDWSPMEIEMVLRHELAHIQRRDTIAQLISQLFLSLNWLNPLAWIGTRQAAVFREEACDRIVLAGGQSKCEYAELLLKHAEASRGSRLRPAAISMAESGIVETRIKQVLNPPQASLTSPWVRLVALVVSVSLAFLVSVVGVAKAQDPNEKDREKIEAIQEKLTTLIFPAVEFEDTPLTEALKAIESLSIEVDSATRLPEEKGFKIGLAADDSEINEARINLLLQNVPASEALRYIAALAGMQFKITPSGIVIVDIAKPEWERVIEKLDSAVDDPARVAVQQKLETLVFPTVEFRDTPLREALEFLQAKSVALDVATEDPREKGVNIILQGGNLKQDPRIIPVTLKLLNVPLSEALRYTVELAQCQYEIGPNAVVVSPITEEDSLATLPFRFASRKAQTLAVTFHRPANGGFELQRMRTARWPKEAKRETLQIGETGIDDQLRLESYTDGVLEVTFLALRERFQMKPGSTARFEISFAEFIDGTGKSFYVKKGERFEIPGLEEKGFWRLIEVETDRSRVIRDSDGEEFELQH